MFGNAFFFVRCFCICMYVRTYIHTYMYVCTYIHTCMCVRTYIHTYMYVCTYIHTYRGVLRGVWKCFLFCEMLLCMYVRTYIHTRFYVCKYARMYIHTYRGVQYVSMHACTYIHTGGFSVAFGDAFFCVEMLVLCGEAFCFWRFFFFF